MAPWVRSHLSGIFPAINAEFVPTIVDVLLPFLQHKRTFGMEFGVLGGTAFAHVAGLPTDSCTLDGMRAGDACLFEIAVNSASTAHADTALQVRIHAVAAAFR
jgi:hypothetical protein